MQTIVMSTLQALPLASHSLRFLVVVVVVVIIIVNIILIQLISLTSTNKGVSNSETS